MIISSTEKVLQLTWEKWKHLQQRVFWSSQKHSNRSAADAFLADLIYTNKIKRLKTENKE